jgi:hypothetical protein
MFSRANPSVDAGSYRPNAPIIVFQQESHRAKWRLTCPSCHIGGRAQLFVFAISFVLSFAGFPWWSYSWSTLVFSS